MGILYWYSSNWKSHNKICMTNSSALVGRESAAGVICAGKKILVTLSAKSSLILPWSKAAFRREGHMSIERHNIRGFR